MSCSLSFNWFVSWRCWCCCCCSFYCILVIMTFWTLHMHFYVPFFVFLLKAIYEHDCSFSSVSATKRIKLLFEHWDCIHFFFSLLFYSAVSLVPDSHGALVKKKKLWTKFLTKSKLFFYSKWIKWIRCNIHKKRMSVVCLCILLIT